MPVSHVLVSFDGSDGACAALADGAAAARESGARLTILALAHVEKPMRCCNMQTTSWNREMKRLAREAISRARSLVDPALDADFVVRNGSRRRDVSAAAVELGCDVIIEPARRGRSRRRLV